MLLLIVGLIALPFLVALARPIHWVLKVLAMLATLFAAFFALGGFVEVAAAPWLIALVLACMPARRARE